ncbi:MAG: YjbQ family protein [Calditrichaeota bacterium]|nr:MAG: YjbQ family protein [Calditrichota bacterium]
MKTKQIKLQSTHKVQFINIDHEIHQAVRASGVVDGICVIFVPHTTAGVTINENADPDVVRDMVMELNKIVPFSDGYHHSEGNSAAHIKSSIISCSLSLIIEGGQPLFGTWQSVYFCEFDGPRTRSLLIKIVADE